MSHRIVDLSVPLRDGSEGVRARLRADPPTYLGHACHAYDLEIPSHTGTYFETAAHLFRDAAETQAYPLDKLVCPGVCLKVAPEERRIGASDLEAAVLGGPGPLPSSCALLLRTSARLLGSHAYFTRDAARWMRDRGIALMGSDTPRYDRSFEEPTGFFVELFEAGIPIVANLTNLEILPPRGFTVVALPLSIDGVCTVPCRVVALVGSAP